MYYNFALQKFFICLVLIVDRVATDYGLDGPGIESLWPSLLYNGYRVFSGGKIGQSVLLTTHW